MQRRYWFIGGAIVLLVGGFFVYRMKNGSSSAAKNTVTVVQDTVLQDVVVTGKTDSSSRVDLAFERGGTVSTIAAKTGDTVKAGQLLIQLDSGELAAQLHQSEGSLASAQALRAQYEAAVAAQQAKLDELLAGTRPETIAIAETDLAKAQQDLVNYYGDIANTIADAYQNADDAARTKTLGMFSGSPGGLYSATYTTCEEQAKNDAQLQRATADRALDAMQKDMTAFASASDAATQESILSDVAARLVLIKQFLDTTRASIANSCLQNDTTVATYRANINIAITNVVTVQTAIQALQQNIAAQKIAVQKLQDELNLDKAGTVQTEIDAQRATLAQAQANLKSQDAQIESATGNTQLYAAQLAKLSLRSPIDGVVTYLDIKKGEIATANAIVVTVIAPHMLEIKANIPESDIAKLAVGNDTTITFDALGPDEFHAPIIFIDPAETIVDGVVNYQVRLALNTADARLKSGLTANLTIHAARKEQVVVVPEYALIEEDAGTFVDKLNADGSTTKTPVTIGMRGTNNLVEIVSGVRVGDTIISVGLK